MPQLLLICFRVNGDAINKCRSETVKKSACGEAGTAAGECQRLVGGSAASVNTGSDIESTSLCNSDDEEDEDDCSSRMSSTVTEQSDVRYTRRRRHRHQRRHRPAAVSQLPLLIMAIVKPGPTFTNIVIRFILRYVIRSSYNRS